MANSTSRESMGNQSTIKALKLLEYLVEVGEPVRLLDLATDMEINVSTAYRFLASLEDTGYVLQDPLTLKYSCTMKICALAHKVLDGNRIRRSAAPHLGPLSEIWGETACVAVMQDNSAVCVAVQCADGDIPQASVYVGKTVPLHCSGAGKLLLLNYEPEEIDALVADRGLPALTDNTITRKDALLDELRVVRERLCACDYEEREEGICSVSVPIFDSDDNICAAISVVGPAHRMTPDRVAANLQSSRDAAHLISRSLGYEGDRYGQTPAVLL